MNTSRQVDVKALVSHILRGDGSDKCRICMGDTTEGQVYLGDTVMLDGEKPVTLAELLETITGVEMESSTSLPNRLCIHCVDKILPIIPFIKLCKDSDSKWKHVIEHLTLPSVPKPRVFVLISSDCQKRELVHSTKKNIKDNTEAVKVLQKRLIWKKCNSIRREKEKQLKLSNDKNMSCPECEKSFYTIDTLNNHIKRVKKKMCPHCNLILDLEAYKSHAETHNAKVYSCDICHECFVYKKYFLLHKLKHSRGKHICPECKLSFSNMDRLSRHVSRHKQCVCSTCNKKFTNKICFSNHKINCAQSRDISVEKFICDYCSKEYNFKMALKMHMKIKHLARKKFQCDKCGKSFPFKAHYIEHEHTHKKVLDRYVCKCGAKYSSRRGYEKHLKKHSREDEIKKGKVSKANYSFKCAKCKDTFANKKDFYKHTKCSEASQSGWFFF